MTDDRFITLNIEGTDYIDIVPGKQEYDLETEDLIYGSELKNGMVVLVESTYRKDEEKILYLDREAFLATNRWCVVTQIREQESQHQTTIYFMGLYGDGRKAVRDSSLYKGWIVKKNTIPVDPEVDPRNGDLIASGMSTDGKTIDHSSC